MKNNPIFASCVIAALTSQAPAVFAGWTGQINGTGFGKAVVNVTAAGQTTPKSAPTPLVLGPNVGMVQGSFAYGAPLPPGASPSTTVNVAGSAGYVWRANTVAVGGDRTDNYAIQHRAHIQAQDFASLSIDTQVIEDTTDGVGYILDIFYKASGGTAFLFRGLWWDNPENPPTEEDIDRLNLFEDALVIGNGTPDPTRRFKELKIELPDELNPNNWENFIVVIDGFADSAVPDGGSLSFAFGASIAGLLAARKLKQRAA